MQLVERSTGATIEHGGLGRSVRMTAKLDGRFFRTQIASIYSEKGKSVIRELMANAFDAHVAAGCADRPIEVYLPTNLCPNLIVRDYGVGMSEEFIMGTPATMSNPEVLGLYAIMGESTKTDDNSQTGMFGVGSKSPLSITEMFTVRAFDGDGTCRQYIVNVPDDGVPEIHQSVVANLTEGYERGIEIRVPCTPEVAEELIKGLATQHFAWFDKPVTLSGSKDKVREQCYPAIVQLAEGLYIGTPCKDDHYGREWKVFVRQGAAVYPLRQDRMYNAISNDIMRTMREMCEAGRHVLIDLPLGSAEVTQSRESIQYGTITTENLGLAVTRAFDGLADKLADAIGTAHSYSTALDALTKHYVPVGQQFDYDMRKLMSALLPLCSTVVMNNWRAWVASLPPGHEQLSWLQPALEPMIRKHELSDRTRMHRGHVYHNRGVPQISVSTTSHDSVTFRYPHVLYVISTHCRDWQGRIDSHIRTVQFEGKLPETASLGMPCYVIRTGKDYIQSVVTSLKAKGCYYGHYTEADLPKPVPKPGASSTKYPAGMKWAYQWLGSAFAGEKTMVDYKTEFAYYVVKDDRENFKVSNGDGTVLTMGETYLKRTIQGLTELGLIDPMTPIYRVTQKYAEKYKKAAPLWKNLFEVAIPKVESYIAARPEALALRDSELWTENLGWEVKRMVEKAKNTYQGGCTENLQCFYNLRELVERDPVFSHVVATILLRGETTESKIISLHRMLFSNEMVLDNVARSRYNALKREFDDRYERLLAALGDLPLHFATYLRGYIIPQLPHDMDMTHYNALRPYVEKFESQLDTVLENLLATEGADGTAIAAAA